MFLLPLKYRQHVREMTGKHLPRSPRPIMRESLHSYSLRLGAMYSLSSTEILERLGLPATVDYHLLEQESEGILSTRLAQVTGRDPQRFQRLRSSAPQLILPVIHRTGYCPKCWLERRREDAAFLDRSWARPYSFTCSHHDHDLLHEWTDTNAWIQLFRHRSLWPELAQRGFPPHWLEICASLGIDAEYEWRHIQPYLSQYEAWIPRTMYGIGLRDDELHLLSDLALYTQREWRPNPILCELKPAPYTTYDLEHSQSRMLRGGLSNRLKAIVIARHLLEALRGHRTSLARRILEDERLHAYLELRFATSSVHLRSAQMHGCDSADCACTVVSRQA